MESKVRTEARGGMVRHTGCVLLRWSECMAGWCTGEGMRGCIYGDGRL
jgi:hypothetical protein